MREPTELENVLRASLIYERWKRQTDPVPIEQMIQDAIQDATAWEEFKRTHRMKSLKDIIAERMKWEPPRCRNCQKLLGRHEIGMCSGCRAEERDT